jgi:thiopeptide-type bacteriocin biosynthesis protein
MVQFASQLRMLAALPAEALAAAVGLGSFGAEWMRAFSDVGNRLACAADRGGLTRGLRAVLAHVVIFHWNRLGLPATSQGILASAARDVYLPRD